MKNSPTNAGWSQRGVPIALVTNRPIASAQSGYSRL